jgi:hypothetical protein
MVIRIVMMSSIRLSDKFALKLLFRLDARDFIKLTKYARMYISAIICTETFAIEMMRLWVKLHSPSLDVYPV